MANSNTVEISKHQFFSLTICFIRYAISRNNSTWLEALSICTQYWHFLDVSQQEAINKELDRFYVEELSKEDSDCLFLSNIKRFMMQNGWNYNNATYTYHED